ncbi:MAG: hypothetical protein L3J26_07025 [Candidatus Polarisedimenticolaceae bacterium]|nr:hypothetical protein [Candidatus Polarisedimenticolaceae bacterium]
MIDMHSHILPGVDDGARDYEQALQMLAMAVEDGVSTQVLTPHIQPGVYNNSLSSLNDQLIPLKQAVQEQGIDIELRLAAELRIGQEIMAMVQSDAVPWLGTWEGRRVFLMEFPHNQIPAGSIHLIQWLLKHDALPMIAHPERNQELQRDIRKLEPFLDAGCLVQVTAKSLAGGFGAEAHQIAVELLRAEKITLLATDCHNLAYRPPDLSTGYKAAAEIIGEQAARVLVDDNPRSLLGIG